MIRSPFLLAALGGVCLAPLTFAQTTTTASSAPAVAVLEPTRGLDRSGKSARAIAVTRDGHHVWTADEDGTVRKVRFDTGDEVKSFKVAEVPIKAISVSADGKKFAIGLDDKTARVYDGETGREIGRRTHVAPVRAVFVDADGTHVASAGGKEILWWKPLDRNDVVVTRITLHDADVTSIKVTDDRTRGFSAGEDKIVCYWAPDTGALQGKFTAHQAKITAMDVNRNGTAVVSGDEGAIVCYWAPADPTRYTRYDGLRQPVRAVALKDDGTGAVISSDNRTTYIEPSTGKERGQFAPDPRPTWTVAIHPGGRHALIGRNQDTTSDGNTGTLKAYELPLL